jgi:tRNA 2-thiouridine synthesizing protein C
MTARRILFVIAHPPHRGALAFEMLDELLVGAVFEQKVSVLFIGDGVFQLIDSGRVEGNVARGYRALSTYDVNDVFVDDSALRRRGMSAESLAIPVRIVARAAVRKLVAAHDVVIPD